MAKQVWRGGNMLYPLPAVMVSCASAAGEKNIVTVAWAGTVCTNPPMLSISLRPERHSYGLIRESGEFVVNLVTRRLPRARGRWGAPPGGLLVPRGPPGPARACDWCGVRSGRDYDKWAECGLTPAPAAKLELAPAIAESPVSIECRVRDVLELGSHHLFLADVAAVQVEESLLDERGRLDLGRAGLVAYSHGEYLELGRRLGSFGYSVRKRPERQAGRGSRRRR